MTEIEVSGGIDKLLPCLLAAKKEIINPKKNTPGHNYKYSDYTEIINTVNEPLHSNDLILSQQIITKEGVMGIKTTLYHISGQFLDNEFYVPSNLKSLNKGNALQEVGSLTTYLKRYAIVTLLCLGTDDDDGASFNARKTQSNSNSNGNNNYAEELNALKKQVVAIFDSKGVDIGTVKDKLAKMKPYNLKQVIEKSKLDGTAMLDYIVEFKGE